MVRTQIQLPDELYARLKEVADTREWSVAEAFRRGAEMLVMACPKPSPRKPAWKMPGPFHLGKILADESEWKEIANMDHVMERLKGD